MDTYLAMRIKNPICAWDSVQEQWIAPDSAQNLCQPHKYLFICQKLMLHQPFGTHQHELRILSGCYWFLRVVKIRLFKAVVYINAFEAEVYLCRVPMG